MLRRIYNQRPLSQVLCGLVFFALCNNATIWAFCPHVSASYQSCSNEDFSSTPHISVSSAAVSHEHHGDMAMSDMNDEDLPASGPVHECATSSDPKTRDIDHEPIVSHAITPLQDSCSHCVMHSQSGINQPSTALVLNNSSSQDIVPAALVIVSARVVSPLTLVEVHDHGPPGLNSSRYILNSSFRI